MNWPALVARVRGLRSRLVRRDDLETLARASDLPALARAFAERGLLPETAGEPGQLELAVRRRASAWLRVMAQWVAALPPRWRDVLAPLHEDEERRSIRALLRGAATAAPPDERLAALVPTPNLPERALRELAGQPTVGAVAGLLVAWGHPLGAPLMEESRRPQPDLLRLDVALTRAWAARARKLVDRLLLPVPLRRELTRWVGDRIDAENARAALVLAGDRKVRDPGEYFVGGGAQVTRDEFITCANAPDPAAAALALAASVPPDTALGTTLERGAAQTVTLDDDLLREDLRAWTRRARTQPLGLAPVIAALLALRAEVRDFRRVIWGVALSAPAPVAGDLLTPA
jgi:vacuolar-type H+-ATPase subunit C/Vma6